MGCAEKGEGGGEVKSDVPDHTQLFWLITGIQLAKPAPTLPAVGTSELGFLF